MTLRSLLLLLPLCLLLACPAARDDDDDATDDDDSAAVDDDDATDDDDAMDDDDTADDCFPDYVPTFDKNDCLDWDGASNLCGFNSDDSVCELVVACGMVGDLSQCGIDCEMMTTVACFDLATVECVMAATCADDCEALAACNYFP